MRGHHVQVNRDLSLEFAAFLAAADWDLALLQEVPPRWAGLLAAATGSESFRTLTARNWMRPLTSPVARVRPHLAGSWEGGSNLILVRRRNQPVLDHRRATICRHPERRLVSMVRLEGGLCVANLHASTGAGAERDVLRAAGLVVEWAGQDAPVMLGGDFNIRPRSGLVFERLEREYGLAGATAPGAIDHILARNVQFPEPAAAWPPERRDVPDDRSDLLIRLSDHAPVTRTVQW